MFEKCPFAFQLQCKKILLSIAEKVKLLDDLHKQKPKLGCHPSAELYKEKRLTTSKSVNYKNRKL